MYFIISSSFDRSQFSCFKKLCLVPCLFVRIVISESLVTLAKQWKNLCKRAHSVISPFYDLSVS